MGGLGEGMAGEMREKESEGVKKEKKSQRRRV